MYVCALFWHRSHSVAMWTCITTSVVATVWLRKHSELSVRTADVKWISDMFS